MKKFRLKQKSLGEHYQENKPKSSGRKPHQTNRSRKREKTPTEIVINRTPPKKKKGNDGLASPEAPRKEVADPSAATPSVKKELEMIYLSK